MNATWTVFALAALGAALALAACGDETPREEVEVALTLPDECYGAWVFTGSDGGLDGQGADRGPWREMTLTRENEIEVRTEDGAVRSAPFRVRRGMTIFSTEPGWFLVADGVGELVVEVDSRGNLHLSQNVYDGFGYWYEPAGR